MSERVPALVFHDYSPFCVAAVIFLLTGRHGNSTSVDRCPRNPQGARATIAEARLDVCPMAQNHSRARTVSIFTPRFERFRDARTIHLPREGDTTHSRSNDSSRSEGRSRREGSGVVEIFARVTRRLPPLRWLVAAFFPRARHSLRVAPRLAPRRVKIKVEIYSFSPSFCFSRFSVSKNREFSRLSSPTIPLYTMLRCDVGGCFYSPRVRGKIWIFNVL